MTAGTERAGALATDPPVGYSRDAEGIALITIDRPKAANALNREAREGLWQAFRTFDADDEATVAILTGAGNKVFCAGGDLKEMAESGLVQPPPDFMPHLNRNITVDKPVIAAVNGVALGGGFLLTQMVDLCVAAEHATFGITEAKWGRGAPWANPLPWLIPPRIALEMLMTARPLSAQRALQAGLVNHVVPAERLQDTARDLALAIAANAPLTVRAAKQMVYRGAAEVYGQRFDEAEDLFAPVYRSQDAQEGPRAFGEHRAPRWVGR